MKEVGYDGPVCIEVEDGTFGKTLEGRKLAVRTSDGSCGISFLPTQAITIDSAFSHLPS